MTSDQPSSAYDSIEQAELAERVSALYDYARAEYDRNAEHYEWLESKAQRYLTGLVVLSGGTATLFVASATGFMHASTGQRLAAVLAFFAGCALVPAIDGTFRAMSVNEIYMPPINEQMLDAFLRMNSTELRKALAQKLFTAGEHQKAVNAGRSKLLRKSHELTVSAFYIALVAAVLFAFTKR